MVYSVGEFFFETFLSAFPGTAIFNSVFVKLRFYIATAVFNTTTFSYLKNFHRIKMILHLILTFNFI